MSGRNGVLWNGQPIRSGSTIILLNGDSIQVNGIDTYCSKYLYYVILDQVDAVIPIAELTCYHTAVYGEDDTRRQPPDKSIHTSKCGTTPAMSPKMIGPFSVGDHVLGASVLK